MNLNLWTKREPLPGDLARLRDEVDRTLDRFFREPGPGAGPGREAPTLPAELWAPPLDVRESDAEVTLRAEIPGVPAKDLDITVAGNTLTIAGRKEDHEEHRGENVFRAERRFGAFSRTILLPESVDPDKITAESDNGVITVHAAKRPGAKPRHVDIKPAPAPGRKLPGAG